MKIRFVCPMCSRMSHLENSREFKDLQLFYNHFGGYKKIWYEKAPKEQHIEFIKFYLWKLNSVKLLLEQQLSMLELSSKPQIKFFTKGHVNFDIANDVLIPIKQEVKIWEK